MKKIYLLLLFILISQLANAQFKSNFKSKKYLAKDTILIDSLSIIPQTLKVYTNNNLLDSSLYKLDFANSKLIFKNTLTADSVQINYRAFPVLLTQQVYKKDVKQIDLAVVSKNPYIYSQKPSENDLFNFEGIDKSGSISRSIGFGNNQDLSLNSNMVLQMSGKLGYDIEFTAAISDDNLPIQPDGNTQQINDFDKVFIQFKRKGAQLIAGDYELRRPDSYFMNYFKRTQGAYIANEFTDKNNFKYTTQAAGAVAKGRSAKNQFVGEEGNQGPYRLTGNNGEQYIIVLSGTERVYIDGDLILRGQENDYVMDYNTSEITFTTKRLITRNSRITVEFEYSDKIYSRSLFFANQNFESEKIKLGFNFYSEQDNPNKPILQSISADQQDFLQTIGNNIDQAYALNVDSIGFNENEILYKRTDSLGFNNIYVYSTNPQLAVYRVGFSYVGKNKGNYVLDINSVANGRVYKFVVPVANILQGDYEPVTLLITPKKQQLATLNGEYKIAKKGRVFTEIAMSNNDVNLFSDLQNNENKGFAYKIIYNQDNSLSKKDSLGITLNTNFSYEYKNENFVALERYRAVEFERDFNLSDASNLKYKEHWTSVGLGLSKSLSKQISYKISSLLRDKSYNGLQQAINAKYQIKNYNFFYSGSFLTSSLDSLEGDFNKQKIQINKTFKKFLIGVEYQEEKNKTFNTDLDVLTQQSFYFNQIDYYFKSINEKNTGFKFNYSSRLDKTPLNNNLTNYSKANTFNGSLELNKKGRSPFTISTTYRTIDYLQVDTVNKNEETLLSRLEYNLNTLKGALQLSNFYELGTGQEPKREYIYLEVPVGQGVYAWVDYNSNGIKELNEFEISRFSDQAKYIRIYRSNNDFIRSNFTSINQTLKLTPDMLFKDLDGFWGIITKLSSVSALRIDKKVLAGDGFLFNPYQTNIKASNLVSMTSFLRNSLFFNRMNPLWGLEYNIQSNGFKSLLTNGFDSKKVLEQSFRLRWNFVRKSNFSVEVKFGDKNYNSELFTEKNYEVAFLDIKPEFGYQFSQNFKISFLAGYKNQSNLIIYGGEEVVNKRFGTELKYNILKKGSFTSQVNYINNKFNGDANSSIGYEFLDGLQSGTNLTWSAGFQRNIANGIQLNFTYEARKSEKVKAIHTGGLQVRAYF